MLCSTDQVKKTNSTTTFFIFHSSANPRFWPKPDGRIWRSGEGDSQKVWTCGLLSCHGQRQVKPLPIPRPCVSILISLSYSTLLNIIKCIALLFGFTLPQNHVLRWDDWLPDYWTIITTITIIILIFIITSPPAVPRWEDRLSSSSQNNLVNLSSGQQLPDRPDSRWALIDQSNSWRRSRNREVKKTNM